MNDSVDKFISFINQTNPRYILSEESNSRSCVNIKHILYPPPEKSVLSLLESYLGDSSSELINFYKNYNGADLFMDVDDQENGLFFYPIAEMESEKNEVLEWFEIVKDEEPEEITDEGEELEIYGYPEWLESSVVFAGFGYAPERFLIPVKGQYKSKVFLFDHDPMRLLLIANDFSEFLDQLRKDPVRLMSRFGGESYYDAIEYKYGA